MTPQQLIEGAREGRKFRWRRDSDETPEIVTVYRRANVVEGATDVDVIAYKHPLDDVEFHGVGEGLPAGRVELETHGSADGEEDYVMSASAEHDELVTNPYRNGFLGITDANDIEWVDEEVA